MGFLFTQKKESFIAIFDIGSGSVGGAIVRVPMDNKEIPVILKSVRTDVKFHKDFDFNFFTKDMISALRETVTSLYDKKIGAPDEIVCVLASPWYLSETRSIILNKEKPFTFTKHLASELIEKEITNLTQLYKTKYGTLEGAPEIIEKNTMSVSLNGYAIEDPVGKKCQSLEMDMVISLAPKLCLDKIKETLSKTFHHTKVSFSTFTLSTYLAIRDKYLTQDSYLLLDISGEITDVGIVTKGILKSVLSFPFGKKTFFDYMCTKLEIELRDAKELFKLYSENNLSDAFKKKIEPLLKSIENSWGEAFKQCISTLPRTLILPNTIFLTTDNDMKGWFVNVLQSEDYIKPTVSVHKSIIVTLDGPEFLNMCDVKNGECDPFLMVEAISIMRKKDK
ncbi:MAG: hypothetical protein WCT42_01760 [Candidatus Paceibacterota bacterium]|jgi:hypothetical protein